MAKTAGNIDEHPFLLSTRGGECFCIWRAPTDRPLIGTLLHLPAFGDEMNKSRAIVARAARAFAALGHGVLQVDLYGCGDSAGEHRDATLSAWSSNLAEAAGWLTARNPRWPMPTMWALRAGALLVSSLLSETCRDAPLLLWQPVLSGSQYLTHLLRQKALSDFELAATARIATKALRARFAAGETLEVGGYAISPPLAREMDAREFSLPPEYRGRIDWLEVVNAPTTSLSPSASSRAENLRESGVRVECQAVAGPGFWQSVEIERCDALVEASAKVLAERERDERRDRIAV